jgi:hypothetical protein
MSRSGSRKGSSNSIKEPNKTRHGWKDTPTHLTWGTGRLNGMAESGTEEEFHSQRFFFPNSIQSDWTWVISRKSGHSTYESTRHAGKTHSERKNQAQVPALMNLIVLSIFSPMSQTEERR